MMFTKRLVQNITEKETKNQNKTGFELRLMTKYLIFCMDDTSHIL